MIHDKFLIAVGEEFFWFLTDGRVLAHHGGNEVLTETHHKDKSLMSLLSYFLSSNYGRSPSQLYMFFGICHVSHVIYIYIYYGYLYLYMCVCACV